MDGNNEQTELELVDEISLSSEFNLLTRDELIRTQALDMAVNSKAQFGGSTDEILERTMRFENYIRNGEK